MKFVVTKRIKRHGVVRGIEWEVKRDNSVKLCLRYELPHLWFTIHTKNEEEIEALINHIILYPVVFRGIALFANEFTNKEILEADSLGELFDKYSEKYYPKYHLTVFEYFIKKKRELQTKVQLFDNGLQYTLIPELAKVKGVEVIKVVRKHIPKNYTYNIYLFKRQNECNIPGETYQEIVDTIHEAAINLGIGDIVYINLNPKDYGGINDPEFELWNHRSYIYLGVDASEDLIEKLSNNVDYQFITKNMVSLRKAFKKKLKVPYDLFTSDIKMVEEDKDNAN